jgi:hypothetical protein
VCAKISRHCRDRHEFIFQFYFLHHGKSGRAQKKATILKERRHIGSFDLYAVQWWSVGLSSSFAGTPVNCELVSYIIKLHAHTCSCSSRCVCVGPESVHIPLQSSRLAEAG